MLAHTELRLRGEGFGGGHCAEEIVRSNAKDQQMSTTLCGHHSILTNSTPTDTQSVLAVGSTTEMNGSLSYDTIAKLAYKKNNSTTFSSKLHLICMPSLG